VTIEYLRFHALERPQALILVDGDREIRYAEFVADLWKFTRAVQEFGLKRGSSVAIGCDDFYMHWLLVLAFEHLGIVTASFHSREGRHCQALLGSVDLVLAEPHYPPGGWNIRAITPAWIERVRSRPEEAPPPAVLRHPDDVLRIVRTSGTTGEPKRFHLTHRMSEARLAQMIWLYRDLPAGGGSLVTLPWSIGGTYRSAMLAIRSGFVLIVGNNIGTAQLPALIRRRGVASLTLLPVQLKQVLDHLPPDWVKPEHMEITCFGAPVPDELRHAALQSLAHRVVDIYGSNELGTISVTRTVGSGGFGTICPDLEVEIVDEADRPVPDGVAGQIRVRNDGGFRGYFDDQTLTRRMLRDNWFYPGDMGVRDGRRLQVIGRTDDQINLGGVKYPLTKIEAAVLKSGGPGVKDVGAVAIADAAGVDEIHVALVTDGSDDRAVLDRVIARLQRIIAGAIHLTRLPQIPRNEMGKIDRALLKAAILALRPG
jgi:2,3-dihydroxybenzoate-AMP ligase